jgi:hypothetical protein
MCCSNGDFCLSKIKQKQTITLKELYSLNSFWSLKRSWKTKILDYFLLVVLTVEGLIISKFVEINIYLSLALAGTFWGLIKLYFFLRFLYRFYNSLKIHGIECSEIKSLSTTVSIVFLNHRSSNLLIISGFLYSSKTQKEVFEPIIVDWQEEYFEALFKKEIWKARWINVRYTYAFLAAMWQKSPIGDLIEFISKLAK